jgi:hypothetical protein
MIANNDPRIPKNADPNIESFIRELLIKDPDQRLGSPGKDITKHPYFEGLSWQKVAKMEIAPEFIPEAAGSDCLANFDEAYTRRRVDEGCVDPESDVMIQDFSFENPSILTSIHSFDDLNGLEAEAQMYSTDTQATCDSIHSVSKPFSS